MKTVSEQELKDILDKHDKFLRNEKNGEPADLSYSDLRFADLSDSNLIRAELKFADLRYANLRSANLSSANLRYADLRSANLRYADLRSANLFSANLVSADLSYANLFSANLRSADLISAKLFSANLISANLSLANLVSADLSYSHLSSADLSLIKKDFYEVLKTSISEVPGLYDSLMRGKIDGSTYSGECACLVGTIANLKKVDVGTLERNLNRAAEIWFLAIRKGDTPQSNHVAEITRNWAEEFARENGINIPNYKFVSSFEFPEVFK